MERTPFEKQNSLIKQLITVLAQHLGERLSPRLKSKSTCHSNRLTDFFHKSRPHSIAYSWCLFSALILGVLFSASIPYSLQLVSSDSLLLRSIELDFSRSSYTFRTLSRT